MKILIISFTLLISYTMHAQTAKEALLVIDVQENLLNPASKMHIDSTIVDSLCININEAIEKFRNNNLPVIYIANEWSNPLLNMLTGNVCKKGGPGTNIDKRIIRVNDSVYKKSRGNALTNESLLQYLKTNHITRLTLCGLFAEYCVKMTLVDGLKKGFTVLVLQDAIGSKNNVKKSKSIAFYKRKGATLVNVGQL
jgi:nicotinamidase-related amidase